jgi:O-6-methylguanine DNA methyltransferase
MNKTYQEVYDALRQVPKGKVTTYGAIGRKVMINPRQVGYILHRNPEPETIPCHRVVKSDGTIASGFAFGGPDIQAAMLSQEGVVVRDGKIDLGIYGCLTL